MTTNAPTNATAEEIAAAAGAAAAAAGAAARAAVAQATAAEAKLKEVETELNQKMADTTLKTQQALSSLNFAMADALSRQTRKGVVDEYIGTGAHVGGSEWGVQTLVERNGLLRGVTMLTGIENVQNEEVVRFKPQYKNDSTLANRVFLNPDLSTLEFTLEATSTKVMQEANQEVANFGISTFQAKSWQHSLGIGLGISGAGGSGSGAAGFVWGGSKTRGEGNDMSSSSTKKLTSSIQTFARTNYYYEPRAFMALEAGMLEPTPGFEAAILKLGDGNTGYTVNALFKEYGTHVCPRVLMGGWWRIEAVFVSKSTTQMLEASNIVSRAISSSKTGYFGYSGSGSGGGGLGGSTPANGTAATPGTAAAGGTSSGGSGKSQKNSYAEGSGSKEMSQSTESEGTVDVHQMWKGGASGGTPSQWRESLSDKLNSNWRVIDRFSEDCIGIWQWVRGASLRRSICDSWINQFCKAAEVANEVCGPPDARAQICEEPSTAQDFRTLQLAARYESLEKNLSGQVEKCSERPGYHFDGDQCVMNICKCGDEFGTEGIDCPVHGEQGCKPSQRAVCNTISCPKDFALDPVKRFAKCKLHICDSDVDRDTCCTTRFAAKNLMLEVRTGEDCPAWFIDIKLMDHDQMLEIESGDGRQEWEDGKDKTLWRLHKVQKNGFEKMTTSRWILTLKEPGVPSHLCVHVYFGDWCPQYPIAFTLMNADMTTNNIIGDIVNLQYKMEDKHGTVCRPLIPRAAGAR